MTIIEPRTTPLTIYQKEFLQNLVRIDDPTLRSKFLGTFIHLCDGLNQNEPEGEKLKGD